MCSKCLKKRNASSHYSDYIAHAFLYYLASSYRKLLMYAIQYRSIHARHPKIHIAFMLRRLLNKSLCRNFICRIQYHTAMKCTEHCNILKPHLRGSVFSDRHARVRPHKLHICVSILSHSNLIKRPREKC